MFILMITNSAVLKTESRKGKHVHTAISHILIAVDLPEKKKKGTIKNDFHHVL